MSDSRLVAELCKLENHLGKPDLVYRVLELVRGQIQADHSSFVLYAQEKVLYEISTDADWATGRKASQTVIDRAVREGFVFFDPSSLSPSESQLLQQIDSCLASRVDIPLHGEAEAAVIYCDIRGKGAKFSSEQKTLFRRLLSALSVYFHYFAMSELSRHLAENSKGVQGSGASELDRILGTSQPMIELRGKIQSAARNEWPVLIRGESGTGKELAARAIHFLSNRRKGAFLRVSCADFKPDLIEAELFGVIKGAYTGSEYRTGLIRSADGGTLFLDEIGELTLEVQAKLLRAIENREVRPVGSDQIITDIDFRLVCATNRDVYQMVQENKFRVDLYERIRVYNVWIPPLGERREDIPGLAAQFASPKTLTKGALQALRELDYTAGNVRRLRTIVEVVRDTIAQTNRIDRSHIEEYVKSMDVPVSSSAVMSSRRDFYRFRVHYGVAVREARDARRAKTEVSEASMRLLKELRSVLLNFRMQEDTWTSVAQRFFGLNSESERKGFLNYIYSLQKIPLFKDLSQPKS